MHNYFVDVTDHAEGSAPNEACGFLHADNQGSLKYMRAENTQKGDQFVVSLASQQQAYAAGRIEMFFHSHCNDDAIFSEEDLAYIEVTKVPWLVYSTKTKHFNFRRPQGTIPPFQGRSFVLGLTDCAGLVMDYFDHFFNLHFPFFVRSPVNLSVGHSMDCITLQNLGFEEVRDGSSKPHDVVLIRTPNSNGLNTHTGVIVREDLLLHQLLGTVSQIEKYSGLWQRLTSLTFRHPKFTSKLPVL